MSDQFHRRSGRGRRALRGPVLRVLGFSALLGVSAPPAAAQGVEVRTNNAGGTPVSRFKIESGAATVNAWYLNVKLGIGTTTPNETLEVAGNVRGNQSGALRISTGSGYVDVGPKNASWSHFYTDLPRYYFNDGVTVDTGNLGSYNEDLGLQTSGTTRITVVNADGDVGIGTAAPRVKLDVPSGAVYAGDTFRVTSPSDGTNSAVLEMFNETNNVFWHITERSGESDNLIFWRNNGAWGRVLTLAMNQRVGLQNVSAPRDRLDISPAGSEGAIFGVDQIVGMNDVRFYIDDAGTTMAGYLDAGRLHLAHTANPGLELRDTDGGVPYVDFSNDNAVDYDARLILNSDAELGLAAARLRITSGNWAGMFFTNTAGRVISLENNSGLAGGGGFRIWDQSGLGQVVDLRSDRAMSITRIRSIAATSTVRLREDSQGDNLLFDWFGSPLQFQMYENASLRKTFVIDHPQDPDRHLVHACVEAPENLVYYRGTGRLKDGATTVVLPAYFEALTREEGRTVQLTPEFGSGDEPVSDLAYSPVRNGTFGVRSIDGRNPAQAFSWEVKAARKDVPPPAVEPDRDEIEVRGFGPYRWYDMKREASRELSLYPRD